MRLIVMLFALLLTACLGPVKTAPVKTYTLSIEPFIHATPKNRRDEVLLITMPTASPGFETNNMVYTMQDHQLNHFANNRWVGTPAQMLAPLLTASIQNSGCFRAVIAPPYAGRANYTLSTHLLVLQQEFNGNGSQERLALQLTLIDNVTGIAIANRQMEVVVPAMQNTPYGGVVAANHAAREILYRVNDFVCRAT